MSEPKHDTFAHVEAGGFGVKAVDCPACIVDGLHLPECNAGCIGDSHVLLGGPHGEPFGHQ